MELSIGGEERNSMVPITGSDDLQGPFVVLRIEVDKPGGPGVCVMAQNSR